MTIDELFNLVNEKTDAELSATVQEMKDNGTLIAFCKAESVKVGRTRDYVGAAFAYLCNMRDHLAIN